jgi:hypothetical protein
VPAWIEVALRASSMNALTATPYYKLDCPDWFQVATLNYLKLSKVFPIGCVTKALHSTTTDVAARVDTRRLSVSHAWPGLNHLYFPRAFVAVWIAKTGTVLLTS